MSHWLEMHIRDGCGRHHYERNNRTSELRETNALN